MHMPENNPDKNEPLPAFWNGKRYFSLDSYLKKTFGEKVYRLSLNGGMTCPNRDKTHGTGGCIFCSAGGSGEFAAPPFLPVSAQITNARERIKAKTDCRKFIAYFQAYTNTYAPVTRLRSLFTEAIRPPEIVALSVATRCDCLGLEVLDLLEDLNHVKPVWVELGLQTIHADTHRFIQSGFSPALCDEAVQALRLRGIGVILHLIFGLPGEDKKQMLSSVSHVATLPVQGVKLQLLHILKGTKLGTLYEKERFPLLSMEDYITLTVDALTLLPPEMVIHRLTGDGPRRLLLAPLWSTDKKRVLNGIQHELKERDLWQGKYYKKGD